MYSTKCLLNLTNTAYIYIHVLMILMLIVNESYFGKTYSGTAKVPGNPH